MASSNAEPAPSVAGKPGLRFAFMLGVFQINFRCTGSQPVALPEIQGPQVCKEVGWSCLRAAEDDPMVDCERRAACRSATSACRSCTCKEVVLLATAGSMRLGLSRCTDLGGGILFAIRTERPIVRIMLTHASSPGCACSLFLS